MTLSSTVVWEVRVSGSDVNGGAYKSDAGTVDYSLQDAAQLAVTDAVTNGTTTITSATGGFTDAMVGNLIYITGGTGSIAAERYEIATRSDTNTITVDRSTGLTTGTGATLNVGGALGSPGELSAAISTQGVADMKAWAKSGAYALTTATLNVSGGAPDFSAGSMNNKRFYLSGYQTTRGDLAAQPSITAGAFAPVQMTKMGGSSGGSHLLRNFSLDGGSQNVNGIMSGSNLYNRVTHCLVSHCDGTNAFSTIQCMKCKAFSCAASGFQSGANWGCWADACVTGFSMGGGLPQTNCIASNNTGDGFAGNSAPLVGCTSYNNSGDGFQVSTSNRGTYLANCVTYGNGGYSYNGMTTADLSNCASSNTDTSGRFNQTPFFDIDGIALTADPFTNAAGGDFSLNTDAGGGALLRAAGINPFGQTGFLDAGAVQHEDAGGGGGGGSNFILGG